MSYVIQNYFRCQQSLYFSPKIKFLIFLKASRLIFNFYNNNNFLKINVFLNYFLWWDFKLFKKFFFSQNLIFFYKYFLFFKYKFFNSFAFSCFFQNLKNLDYFLDSKPYKFNYYSASLDALHHNSYFFHYERATFNFKKNAYKQFFFYLINNHCFLWPSFYNIFKNLNHWFLINNYFLTNFFYNTFFFNVYKY